jgi:hypothetical protein
MKLTKENGEDKAKRERDTVRERTFIYKKTVFEMTFQMLRKMQGKVQL